MYAWFRFRALGDHLLATGLGHHLGADIAPLPVTRHCFSPSPASRSFRYSENSSSASGTACLYRPDRFTDFVATDQGARPVQHTWINHDKDLLDVTVRDKDGHTATLHTTANHPFRDDTTHTWTPAGNLHHGDALNTETNSHAYVVSNPDHPPGKQTAGT